jgi:ribosomal protein S12 methylthiotransferase accessory factor
MKGILEKIEDEEVGLIKRVVVDLNAQGAPKLFLAHVVGCDIHRICTYSQDFVQINTSGRGLTKEEASNSAVGEYLERYSAQMVDENRLIYATYKQMVEKGHRALKPTSLPLYSQHQYDIKDFKFKKFTEDNEINWIEGYSLITKEPIWVPAQCVYLVNFKEKPIRPLDSNGLALGKDLNNAYIHGLGEVIERDAIAITWFNKLPAPRLPVKGEKLVKTLRKCYRKGLKYYFCDITTDIKIPTVFCILVSRSGLITGAATNVCLEDAMVKALYETAGQGYVSLRSVSQLNRPIKSFDEVKTIEDHMTLYANPDMIKYCSFLLNSEVRRREYPHVDKKDVLSYILKRIKERGLDAISVEITHPDIKSLGFRAVRMIVPGAMNISAGLSMRFLGVKRLYEVPSILGYRNRSTSEDELYQVPHPFP